MYEWETRLTTRDENRVVRPLEWGFEWIEPFLETHGFGAAIPGPEVVSDPVAAEAAMVRINQLLIRHSDAFFGYERPSDFRLEERHPSSIRPMSVRRRWPRKRRSASKRRRARLRGSAVSAFHLARAHTVSRERPGERALVSRPAHKSPKRPKQAIIVLPQWNSDGFSHNSLCTIFNRMGISALRLSMPYHDIRRPAELERSDDSVSANIGRTLSACRQAVVNIRCCLDWLEEQGTSTLVYLEPASGRATHFWPAPTTRASG